jgi:hypothetical protein
MLGSFLLCCGEELLFRGFVVWLVLFRKLFILVLSIKSYDG